MGGRGWSAACTAWLVSACVPANDVSCPNTTVELAGACTVSCTLDDECLIGEVCDTRAGACTRGEGERPLILELRAEESSVAPGRPAHLYYSTSGATRVSIDNQVLATSS